MSRPLDRIGWYIALIVLGFVLGSYISNSWIWGGVLSALCALTVFCLIRAIPKSKRGAKLNEFRLSLLLAGKPLSNRYLFRLFPPKEEAGADCDHYVASDGALVVNAYGWSKLSEEGACKLYRQLSETSYPVCRLFCQGIDRKALPLMGYLPTEVEIVKIKRLYHAAKETELPALPKRIKRVQFKQIVSELPSPRVAFYLAFSSLSSLVLSFLLPIANYYRIWSGICAIGSVAVFVWHKATKN